MHDENSPECRIANECLAMPVRVLNRVITGIYDDALRAHNVRVSQMNVLVAIAAGGPARATDVCRRLRLEKSTLSRDLDRLLERGWVQAVAATGRSQNLEITSAGRALIERVMPAWEAAQKRVHELLGPKLTKELVGAVKRLQTAEAEDL